MLLNVLCKFVSLLLPFECLTHVEQQRLLMGLNLLRRYAQENTHGDCACFESALQHLEAVLCKGIRGPRGIVFVRQSDLKECLQRVSLLQHKYFVNNSIVDTYMADYNRDYWNFFLN